MLEVCMFFADVIYVTSLSCCITCQLMPISFFITTQAERSDILSRPSLYKLLYAFEIHRHNWQKAASYIYLYSARLKTEGALGDNHFSSSLVLERLNGLSAAINALHLVHPDFMWIEPLFERDAIQSKHYPSKKAKRTVDEQRKKLFIYLFS